MLSKVFSFAGSTPTKETVIPSSTTSRVSSTSINLGSVMNSEYGLIGNKLKTFRPPSHNAVPHNNKGNFLNTSRADMVGSN